MRVFRVAVFVFGLVFVFVFGAAASAANLKVKVVDPQSAAVADAQVLLLRAGEAAVVSAQTTSAEGTVVFRAADSGKYQVKVLAPGFAVEIADVQTVHRAGALIGEDTRAVDHLGQLRVCERDLDNDDGVQRSVRIVDAAAGAAGEFLGRTDR